MNRIISALLLAFAASFAQAADPNKVLRYALQVGESTFAKNAAYFLLFVFYVLAISLAGDLCGIHPEVVSYTG